MKRFSIQRTLRTRGNGFCDQSRSGEDRKTFRDALRTAYNDRCAITGCSILHVLEAAHIYPYRGPDTNKVTNGLLLRADVHTLFDCHLLTIDSATMTVLVAPHLRDSEYGEFHGRPSARA